MAKKECYECMEEKTLREFPKDGRSPDGRGKTCTACKEKAGGAKPAAPDAKTKPKAAKPAKKTALVAKPGRAEEMTIPDRLNAVAVKLGEKLVLRRFVRYQLGEGLD